MFTTRVAQGMRGMCGTEQAGSGFWLSVCTERGSSSSPRTCAREPSRGACRARPPGGATESSRRGGAAAEPERYVGARTARSRGPAAPDGVPSLGRDPAREGAYRSVRPPRPAGHDQLGLRHPPLSEYARRGPLSLAQAVPAPMRRARYARMRLAALGGTRAAFARTSVLAWEDGYNDEWVCAVWPWSVPL